MSSLEQLVHEVEALAPLPAAAAKLARISADPEANLSEAAEAVRFDPALTADVLRFANSPMAGSLHRIRTIRDAILRLGVARVLAIAVRAQVQGRMRQALPEYGLSEEELWQHSVAAAIAAELLMRAAPMRVNPVAFTAALLHDIGKLIVARHLDSPTLARIRELAGTERRDYYSAEREVLGYTHADLGAHIARHWGLGDDIAAAIAGHHDQTTDAGPGTDILRVSNVVAKTIGYGLGHEGMNLEGDSGACERLGVDRARFEAIAAETAALLYVMTGTLL